ncbi:MAG: demethoxyubiquinone hydroxylase family protein [Burkholderiaceae bacterium]|nr:demethoxyubiquinone hydroxylase family protein [Burkholderiaceae bacterium]
MDRLLGMSARVAAELSVGGGHPVRGGFAGRSSIRSALVESSASGGRRADQRSSAARLRVARCAVIGAQGLFEAQALLAQDPALHAQGVRIAREKARHLAWMRARLGELGERPSAADPACFVGGLGLGLVAARFGARASNGLRVEAARQAIAGLQIETEGLPPTDGESRRVMGAVLVGETDHLHAIGRQPGAAPAWLGAALRACARRVSGLARYL